MFVVVDSIDLMLCRALRSTNSHWDMGDFYDFRAREIAFHIIPLYLGYLEAL